MADYSDFPWRPGMRVLPDESRADRIRRDALAELGCLVLDLPQLADLTGGTLAEVEAAVTLLCADGSVTRVEGGWTVMPW